MKEVIFNFQSDKDVPFLEHLLSYGAPKVEAIQVRVQHRETASGEYNTSFGRCLTYNLNIITS